MLFHCSFDERANQTGERIDEVEKTKPAATHRAQHKDTSCLRAEIGRVMGIEPIFSESQSDTLTN